MENFIFEIFIRILETFLRIFGQFLRNSGEIGSLLEGEEKNFHQSENNKENEVLRPLWPPNSLGGHI